MKKNVISIISLGVIALLAGGMWLFEVLYKGWYGLIWLEYFHKAIPFITLFFMVWVLAVSQVKPFSKKVLFFCVLAGLSFVWTFLTSTVLTYTFYVGFPPVSISIRLLSIPWFIAGPFIYFFVLERFGIIIPIWKKAISAVLYAGSLPFGLAILFVVSFLGFIPSSWVDFIHVVKTGAAVPFVVFGLGLPIITEAAAEDQEQDS